MGVKLLGKIKIHEIAKKVGLASKDVIEKAKELGMKVTSHLSTVENEDASRLENELKGSSESETDKKAKKAKEAKGTDTPVIIRRELIISEEEEKKNKKEEENRKNAERKESDAV